MTQTSKKLRVEDVMSTDLLVCSPEQTLSECACRMRKENVSSIFVKQDGRIIGVWTEGDCTKVDFSDPDVFLQSVEQYMTSPVKTILQSTQLSEVTVLFHNSGFRHLLVTKGGDEEPVGVISLSDVVRSQGLEHYLHFKTIESSYVAEVPITQGDISVARISEIMRQRRSNCVLIDNAEIGQTGIITERDLLTILSRKQVDKPAWHYASWPLLTVHYTTSLFKAYQILKLKQIRHLIVEGDNGEILGVLALRNILSEIESAYMQELETVLYQRDRALKKSQKNLYLAEQIINASPDGIMITDSRNTILQVNPAFTQLTGFGEQEVLGQKPSMLSSGRHDKHFYDKMWAHLRNKGVWQGEIYNRKRNGEIFLEWLTIICIRESDEEEALYAAIFSDITERKRNEKRIKTLAYFDELTHLPNRRLFNDRLEMALATAHRDNSKIAVMFLDLDHFKQVNDTLGHSAGDELLKQVAKRLQNCMHEGDTLARLGGDEFTLLLTEIDEVKNIHRCAASLIEALRDPIQIGNTEIVITTSIGGAIYPDDGQNAETLLKHADIAMYRSKEIGRNSFQLYKPAMNARSLERMAIENKLKQALKKNEFSLYYQPKIDSFTHQIVGAEALLRWHDSELGFISPANFIPLAEELGLIVDIDIWVINAVCKQIQLWHKKGIFDKRISANVSALHFTQGNLAQTVKNALNIWQIDGRYLEIEITESSFIRSLEDAKKVLKALKKLGVSLSLDDFGTGYSALSYLARLPIDTLKIDASFVAKVPDEYGNSQIVKAIVAMAHSLELNLVAEGVEQAHQLAFLQELDCQAIQGYFFSKPLSAEQFELFCEAHRPAKLQIDLAPSNS
ncbi:EAL domain-containing protein [Pseudoalteromonas sp.]|uniref:EAL domain-containing protein n=1 Tax=Pseudoalteromonas sp. TaxID=53249 RepID=UPI0035650473